MATLHCGSIVQGRFFGARLPRRLERGWAFPSAQLVLLSKDTGFFELKLQPSLFDGKAFRMIGLSFREREQILAVLLSALGIKPLEAGLVVGSNRCRPGIGSGRHG